MGVKLQNLVIKKKIDFSQLAGKIIAVDAPNIIMALFNFSYKNKSFSYSDLMIDNTQRAISHLYGILFRVNFYYSKKIFPIFCFDGKDSELKRIVSKDLLNDFLVTKKWYENAIQSGKKYLARQLSLGKEFLWPNILRESKQLIGALGIPYIESPASAESQCAQIVKNKIAFYSNSHDFDSLLFGCPRVIQNFSKSMRRKVQGKWKYKKIEPMMIDLLDNLKRLKINQFQLIGLAILIGTDYFPGVKGIGPKTALKLLKKYGSLDKVIQNEKINYDFTQLTPKLVKNIRKIFLLPEVNESIGALCWNPPNKGQVLDLLCKNHHLNLERVSSNVDKTIKNFYSCQKFFKNNNSNSSLIQTTLDVANR